MLCHSTQAVSAPPILFRTFAWGAYGVVLFYSLSSFSLFLAHSEEVEGVSLKRYFAKRFFRIAPMFYLVLLANFLWTGFGANFKTIVLSLLFLHDLLPDTANVIPRGAWSVGVETLFYLLLPFFLRRHRRPDFFSLEHWGFPCLKRGVFKRSFSEMRISLRCRPTCSELGPATCPCLRSYRYSCLECWRSVPTVPPCEPPGTLELGIGSLDTQ